MHTIRTLTIKWTFVILKKVIIKVKVNLYDTVVTLTATDKRINPLVDKTNKQPLGVG